MTIFNRDGPRVWVSADLGGSVQLIDVGRHNTIARIPRQGRQAGRGKSVAVIYTVSRKSSRRFLAESASGEALRGNSLSNTISGIDTVAKKAVRTIATEDWPWGVAIR